MRMPSIREHIRTKETPKQRLGVQLFEERIARLSAEGNQEELACAEAEYELFLWQHDVTGALKDSRFGTDVRVLLDEADIHRGPDGLVQADTDLLRQMHLVQVNMSELDRLNSSGDHALGDAALERVFLTCQHKTMEVLREAFPEADELGLLEKYDIYRTAGNDFTIVLKQVSSEQAIQLRERLSRPMSIADIRPDQDDVPLAASQMSFIDAFQYLENMDGLPAEAGMSDQTAAIGFMREKCQTINDFDKVRTRGERMVQKLKQSRESGTADAQTLYEQFLKKYVGVLVQEAGEMQPPDFAEFSRRLEKMGAFDAYPMQWKKQLFERSRDEALRQLHARSSDRQKESEVITESVIVSLQDEQRTVGLERIAEPQIEKTGTKRLREIGEADVQAQKQFLAALEQLGQTEGQLALNTLKNERDRVASLPEGDIARRQAEVRLALEQSKRDQLTGLYGRGMYFEQLEHALKKGMPQTVLSVDMAFLKFFDKEGGTKTGDAAIEAAGRILDAAKREMGLSKGVAVEAYRVGGDEFALLVQSADPQVTYEISRLLQRLSQETVGEIPSMSGAADTYHPESLQFNVGGYTISSLDDFQIELAGMGMPALRGEPGSIERIRCAADEATHLADARIDSEKSLNRLAFLLGKSLEATQADALKGERRKRLEVLMTYSEKSIFGAEGKAKIAEWTDQIGSSERTVHQIIAQELPQFVTEQLKKKGKEEVNFERMSLERLEADVQLTLLRKRMEEMERDMQFLLQQFGEAHAKVDEQRSHLAEVEAQLSEVVQLRQKIDKLSP